MNVLIAEAEVPYDQVFEMEDINGEFGQADVAIILGANDVVNPPLHTKGSPIYGMPILEAYKAKTVIVNKRPWPLAMRAWTTSCFYMDKTMMVFGDAKKVVEDMVKAVEEIALQRICMPRLSFATRTVNRACRSDLMAIAKSALLNRLAENRAKLSGYAKILATLRSFRASKAFGVTG